MPFLLCRAPFCHGLASSDTADKTCRKALQKIKQELIQQGIRQNKNKKPMRSENSEHIGGYLYT